jgi:hypothetical protein
MFASRRFSENRGFSQSESRFFWGSDGAIVADAGFFALSVRLQ